MEREIINYLSAILFQLFIFNFVYDIRIDKNITHYTNKIIQ